MANITVTEQVHVDIRVDGETITHDFDKGVHEVDQHVADLLIAQGIAIITVAEPKAEKPSKKTSAPAAEPTETLEA